MPLCSRPSGAARGLATTIAAVTLAAITMASPGRAQTAPGAGEPEAPQPGVEAPPGPPSSIGQAPAASTPAPAATQTPAPSGQTAGAPPRRPLAVNRPGGSATVAANVNLRREPDTNSEILTTIPAGTAVHVGECDGEWCKVVWNGHTGFAVARNLNLGGPRQAGLYPRRPGQPGGPGYPDDYNLPGYYGPPVVYGAPAYSYGPGVYYYGRPWGWRRYWW
jgi:hypothetical protein